MNHFMCSTGENEKEENCLKKSELVQKYMFVKHIQHD